MKKLLLVLITCGYIIYFGFAMSLKNPFFFISQSDNSTSVLDKYIFSNNKGKK